MITKHLLFFFFCGDDVLTSKLNFDIKESWSHQKVSSVDWFPWLNEKIEIKIVGYCV